MPAPRCRHRVRHYHPPLGPHDRGWRRDQPLLLRRTDVQPFGTVAAAPGTAKRSCQHKTLKLFRLSHYAASLTPSKGRLILCTVPG